MVLIISSDKCALITHTPISPLIALPYQPNI
jgi:hypothetical protein